MTFDTSAALPPIESEFLRDVVTGLALRPKRLPCKYFYDRRGAYLFDSICELDAYYPTRTELAIMRAHAAEMAALVGPRARLVELGSGSSLKTRLLLDRLPDLAAYVPVDISRPYLTRSARALFREYPHLTIQPVCADYSRPFALPDAESSARTVVYFPGSTIGNFHPHEAQAFLAMVAGLCKGEGGLVIGVDLQKDTSIIERAYNDEEGVTAAFNLNILTRINRELGGDFDLERFAHRAVYDARGGRIEMRLVSAEPQVVRVGRARFAFDRLEPIVTEYSYKYAVPAFAKLAAGAGFSLERVWLDERRLFSVQYYALANSTGSDPHYQIVASEPT
ncbi:MAG TPA: L-histidine N(alpha)-methyltransferase [Polyangiaceae bacterium]|nr:L-histidine N(alpha)-methyltransferase [Polyangiaceae bacterium]